MFEQRSQSVTRLPFPTVFPAEETSASLCLHGGLIYILQRRTPSTHLNLNLIPHAIKQDTKEATVVKLVL